jgi:hypothetical protein
MSYSDQKPVQFVIDVTECKKVSLRKVLSMKEVLDNHRPNSRRYIDYTTVLYLMSTHNIL